MSVVFCDAEKDHMEELEIIRHKIQVALHGAHKRTRRNISKANDIDLKFIQLEVMGINLLEILKEFDQELEWMVLIDQLCQLLVPQPTVAPFMTLLEARHLRQKDIFLRQKKMMELTRLVSRKLLFEGKYNQAIPIALHSLRFSIDVYGLKSVNLVPSYIILSETYIGLGKLTQADEYLAQAEWTVLKSLDATNALKSNLYRNIGVLHAEKGDYDNALRMFSEDIYHASLEWGTVNIRTSGGYFQMANVFLKQENKDAADSLFSEVTSIWFDFLTDVVQRKTASPSTVSLIGLLKTADEAQARVLEESEEMEAKQMLHAICVVRESLTRPHYAVLTKIYHTLSMFYFVLDDLNKAQEYGRKAILASERVPPHIEAVSLTTNFLKLSSQSPDPTV